MNVNELSHEQLMKISQRIPEWVAYYMPKWMAENMPEWVAENRHEPREFEPVEEVPQSILNIL